jgi:hypothetical protein
MTITFKLDMAEKACSPGLDQACSLFEPGQEYTLIEMVQAGLDIRHVAWMISARVAQDGSTMGLMRTWARACCKQQKVRRASFGTVQECGEAIQSAMRQWAKGKPTSKGAREWAYSKLVDLIYSGEY